MYHYLITVLALAHTSVQNIEVVENTQTFGYLNYFNNLRNVHLVDLDRADNTYIDRCIKSLMKLNITPCVVREDLSVISESSENKVSNTTIDAMKECVKEKGRDTGNFILMFSPREPGKVMDQTFKKALVALTTSPTIFLFHGIQNVSSTENDTTVKDLENFLTLVWSRLRMPRAVAAILKHTGEPILCTYDPEKWNRIFNYGRGIRFFTNELIAKDDTIIFNPKIMYKYPLQIAFFQRYPTSYRLPEPQMDLIKKLTKRSWGYAGLDGFLMGDVIEAFKFNAILNDFGPWEPYGYLLSNGSVTGTLDHIVTMKSDIAFNSRFLKPYGVDDYFDFLSYVHTDSLCLIVTKAGPIPTWTKVGRVYKAGTWTAILVLVMIISFLRWLQLNMPRGKGYKSLVRVTVETYMLMLVPVGKVARAPLRQRMLLTICLFMNLILVSVFQGNLHAAFNTHAFYPDINTLDGVDKSNILILISRGFKSMFANSNTETYQHLNDKVQFASGVSNNVELIAQGSRMTTLARESDIKLQAQTVYVGPTGLPLLHVVPECPMTYKLTYIVSKDFPFKRHISDVITRLVEAGLPTWYYDITNFVIITHNRSQIHESSNDCGEPLQIEHIISAFIILFLGVTVSLLFLLGEIYVHSRKMVNSEHAVLKRWR